MPPRMPGTHRERLEKQERGDVLYLVAWLDSMPVGHLLLKWVDSPISASNAPNWPTLSDIAVRPGLQSRGIGSKLMDHAEHLAARRGYHHVGLSVALENVRARALYERRGYRDSGLGTHCSRWPYLDERGQEQWREETCVRLVRVVPSDMFRLGSFAVIFNENREVLLCHRGDIDAWNLPGGRVERGESPWDVAIRETRKEVGLVVEVDHLAGIYHKPEQYEVVFSFTCRVVGGHLATSDEADEIRFFSVHELPANTLPKQVQRIHDALLSTQQPVLRDQVGPSTRQLMEQGLWPTS